MGHLALRRFTLPGDAQCPVSDFRAPNCRCRPGTQSQRHHPARQPRPKPGCPERRRHRNRRALRSLRMPGCLQPRRPLHRQALRLQRCPEAAKARAAVREGVRGAVREVREVPAVPEAHPEPKALPQSPRAGGPSAVPEAHNRRRWRARSGSAPSASFRKLARTAGLALARTPRARVQALLELHASRPPPFKGDLPPSQPHDFGFGDL